MEIIDANTIFGVWPKKELDMSLEKLLGIMKKNNVARFLSVSMKGILYDYDEGNTETLAMSKKHPQLIPVATCDLRKYYGRKDFIRKIVKAGFKAVRLFPDFQGWHLGYEPFYEFWDEMQSSAVLPLIITASGLGFITSISRFPNNGKVPIIITSVEYKSLSEALAAGRKQPHVYFETASLNTPDGLEILVKEIGADRIIFGSYSPINYFRSSFASLDRANLKDEEKLLIASGNIKRILGV